MAATKLPDPRVGRVRAPDGYGFPTDADADAMLTWSAVDALIGRARTYWLGTVGPAGRPYATPLWAVWIDGVLWFDGMPATRWARNFAANPAITFGLEADGVAVMLDGLVEDLETDVELGARIVASWNAKYGHGAPMPVERGLFRLRPQTVRAWSEALSDGARWTFGPEAAS